MAPVPAYDLSTDELSMALSYVSGSVAVPAAAAAGGKKAKAKAAPKKVCTTLLSDDVLCGWMDPLDPCIHQIESLYTTTYMRPSLQSLTLTSSTSFSSK